MTDPIVSIKAESERWKASAQHGGKAWAWEQVISLLLVPLSVWGVFAAVHMAGLGYDGAQAFFHDKLNAALFAVLAFLSAMHMRDGVNAVLDDYLRGAGLRAARLVNLIVATAVIAAVAISLYKLAFGA